MGTEWIFDAPHTQRITRARWEWVESLLPDLIPADGLKEALDVGCGVGAFANLLHGRGFRVTGVDGREENVREAARRFPEISFVAADIESPAVRDLGRFDFVLCVGLLYHLENPLSAIRNLEALTSRVLVVESRIAPGAASSAMLLRETSGVDQALGGLALIPTERFLVDALYVAGFAHVYHSVDLPAHEEFVRTPTRARRRTVLVASRTPLRSPRLRRAGGPPRTPVDIWRWAWLPAVIRRPGGIALNVLFAARRLLGRIPRPVRLPWGGWWLRWNDAVSARLRSRDDFEPGERRLAARLLRPGMTVFDVGAHHGLYSLLASHEVGPSGRVVSFEPSPRELRRLRLHLALNRVRNVRVVPTALGSGEGVGELFIPTSWETGCNSLRRPEVDEPVDSVRVPITTLDQFVAKSGGRGPHFLKMDVEGAELDVLKGARELLSGEGPPIVLAELSDVRTGPWGYRAAETYAFLEQLGYRWYAITDDGRLEPSPPKETYHENLVAVPASRAAEVAQIVV